MNIDDVSLKGYIKEQRAFLEKERCLSDPEVRLLRLHRLMAGYDPSRNNFNKTKLSYRDIKNIFLPAWSPAKISDYTQSLITKKLLRRLGGSVLSVSQFTDNKLSHSSDQGVQMVKQVVQPTEQNIQVNEQIEITEERRKERIKNLKNQAHKIARGKRF